MNLGRLNSIPPLTKCLLPAVPWFLKCIGSLNNRWNESVVNAILQTRDDSTVIAAWKDTIPDEKIVKHILDVLEKEMGWENPRFIPEDECFIVLKMWWHGFADCWERERCLWALEKVFDGRFSSAVVSTVVDATLGDFLRQARSEQSLQK